MIKRLEHYLFSVALVGVVTILLIGLRIHINSTTVALSFLLVVLVVATIWGSRPAYVASILGVLSFNYFFLLPYHTFAIADSQNWVALGAFLMTALIAGELSALVQRRAKEAESRRQEIEGLYHQLQSAFERASEAEALKRSERLKSALLDAVTHHLRTPLTSMKAAVTTLLAETNDKNESHLDPEGHLELLEVINHEADRLNRFVESLVEIARIEAGELKLRLRWVSVEEIITNALQRASTQTTRHLVELDLEKELPPVLVDAGSMAEVIYILLENATKYSPAGTVVRIQAVHDKMNHVRIIIEDQGYGIPEELRQRVFDKFFRVASDGPGKPEGLGMGLAIARGIVDAHAGRIWAESEPGKSGTRMLVEIPIGQEQEFTTAAERVQR